MAIRGAGRIEAPGELELGFGGNVALVLEDQDLVLEKGITNFIGLGIYSGVSISKLVIAVWPRKLVGYLPDEVTDLAREKALRV